jgi:hypothetical protein
MHRSRPTLEHDTRLQARLRDLAAVTLELAHEHLTIVERLHRHYDELERTADHLYAQEQDLAGLLGLED